MRVLHVVAPAGIGGLERVVQTLAVAQRARGDDVHVASVFTGDAKRDSALFSEPLRSAGVGVSTIVLPSRAYAQERAAVAAIGLESRAEVVHTHGYRPDVVDGRLAHGIGAASVTTVHGFTGGGVRNRIYEWLQTRAFRRFDAVVAVSRPIVSRLSAAGIERTRVHLVVNAWRPFVAALDREQARAELGLRQDAFVVGWVGRLSREKGLDVLVGALPMLQSPAVQIAVVGEGPERAALEPQVAAIGATARVAWCGIVPDAARLFRAFDVFVLSSRTEGTPMVLYEAMRERVPIVAARVGGIPDMLSPDEATLVPPGDSEGFAMAIRDVMENPAAALARADRAAARLARDADVGVWAEAYAGVYDAAVERSRASRASAGKPRA